MSSLFNKKDLTYLIISCEDPYLIRANGEIILCDDNKSDDFLKLKLHTCM